jgi:hypothetical protein
VFEIRLRVLDLGGGSFLGITGGFPQVLEHWSSPGEVEADLLRALIDHLQRIQDLAASRLQWDDFPTVRTVRLRLSPASGWFSRWNINVG